MPALLNLLWCANTVGATCSIVCNSLQDSRDHSEAQLIDSWSVPLLEKLPVAVMPTVLLGGPLALLALLFPAVCGGLTLFLRRWRAFLSVLSICSTAYLLHGWFCSYLFDSWWESQLQLWFCMALIAAVGLMCHRRKDAAEIPRATAGDVLVLGLMAFFCVFGLLWGVIFPTSMLATYVHPLIVMVAGAIGGIWYAFRQRG
ncbi:MAG: hypothetical protein AABP62_21955, partial [Planctomycetota bacterium]